MFSRIVENGCQGGKMLSAITSSPLENWMDIF